MKVTELSYELEKTAPLAYQESYDNSGLLLGNPEQEITGVLVSLDVTIEVIDEAIAKGCNLIVAHHPLIFSGLKKITGATQVEKIALKAIKNDIAIYAVHTNLDNAHKGVNYKIAERLGLENIQILKPKSNSLMKLVVFVPLENTQKLMEELHKAGAGQIGNYSNCSFKSEGIGSFTPNSKAQPVIGSQGVAEEVKENRVEVVFPAYKKTDLLQAMRRGHPYEEIAYYLQNIENTNPQFGSGALGELPEAMEKDAFLAFLKKQMNASVIRYTPIGGASIKKIAICGGAGKFLLNEAIKTKADVFISSDFKYHDFFEAESKIMIADIGHFESEQFTKDLIVENISKFITNFATYLSEIDTNPIKYYY
jgi:dinuclear metal center YbgI/SA1388 family protein